MTLSRMAQDLILFSMPELGYFTLPQELCTGSSIMPQKKNPDGLELVRAKSAVISANLLAITSAIRALPSGYNRDFQETKGPFFKGCETGLGCVRIIDLTISKLTVNEMRLRTAFAPEIFATDRAFELVAGGMSFRDAYKEVGRTLESLGSRDPEGTIAKRTSTGSVGNLNLGVPRAKAAEHVGWLEREEKQKRAKIARLAGGDVELFREPLRQ